MAAALATVAIAARAARAETNLVLNGDLAAGSGTSVAHWQRRMRAQLGDSELRWNKPAEGTGELEIDNSAPSEWRQALYLRPGWYRVSAEVRVEGVANEEGAHLALLQSSGLASSSPRLRGTTSWTPVKFFIREYRWGSTVAIACRLGPSKRRSKGRAWFRNIAVVRVAGPDLSGPLVGDFSPGGGAVKSDEGGADKPLGVIAGLLLAALLGWATVTVWRPAFGMERSLIVAAIVTAVAVAALEVAAVIHFEGHPDVSAKSVRAILVALHGPAQAYDPHWPLDSYPPGSIYPLWFAGWMGRLVMPGATGFRILVETPPIIASLLLALTIFFVALERASSRRAFFLMLLFALNPAFVYDTVIWGQSDSTYALPMLLAAVLIFQRRRVALGWATAALAALVKPQAIALLPVLGVWTLFMEKPARWVAGATAVAVTVAIVFMPFQIGHPPGFFVSVYASFARRFPQASVDAFNLHALLGGWRLDDRTKVFSWISYSTLGILLTLATYGFVAWVIWRGREPRHAMFAAFVALLGFFLFAPRMHERYVYAAPLFLVPLALEAPQVTAMFAVLSTTFLANLAYTNRPKADLPFPLALGRSDWIVICCALANLVVFVAAVAWATYALPVAAQGKSEPAG